jgi:succinate dehydrogenase / fumarate reductase membrane anchor subunit
MDKPLGLLSAILLICPNIGHRLLGLDNLMTSFTKFLTSILLKKVNEGTAHWVSQRLISIILIPLTFIFIIPFVTHVGLDYDQIVAIYTNPYRAVTTLLFFYLTLLHFKQGAQVVIEDYIHDYKTHKILLTINTTTFWFLNLCIFFAMARMMFSL